MAYVVGLLVSGTCSARCVYPVTAALPPGYSQVEILLTGWHTENLGGSTPLQQLTLGTRPVAYDPVTGHLAWEAIADIRHAAGSGDEYRFTLYFSIILTKLAGARLRVFQNHCSSAGGGECHSGKILPHPNFPGWDVLAIGIRGFTLEAGTAGGLLLSRLGLKTSYLIPPGTSDVVSSLRCTMQDVTPTEPITCRAELVGVIAAPGEGFAVHFSSRHYGLQFLSLPAHENPPALPVDGAFGGLEAFSLSFGTSDEAKTWSLAADYNDILLCPDDVNFCYNRFGFLGDTFGAPGNVLKFLVELAGFGIWTRP
ncbi:MAG: hypothetical protein ACREOQ_22160 [Gemmatimonadales bacterium]